MSVGKVIGYSIFSVAAAAVGTIVIAIGAGMGFMALNRKAANIMFGVDEAKNEPFNRDQA